MTSVLVVGSGGREHALAWKLSLSPRIDKLYVAPGNGGTHSIAVNVPINAANIDGLVSFAEKNKIGLTIVGPDNSLALGIVDEFQKRGLRIFGPTRAAAEIESSKVFAKRLMKEAGVPTASFHVFSDYEEALKHIRYQGAPIVVKASGLALGKGVYPCQTLAEAESALAEIMLRRIHGSAGDEVIVEEFLEGQEVSVHAFCDGKTSVLLPLAHDHKPILNGNQGKNTGGMGTIAPVHYASTDEKQFVKKQIVGLTLNALRTKKRPFTGMLYPGLIMTKDGPKALEFNARFGDPETQIYMRLLATDLLDILEACVDGTLSDLSIEWFSGYAVCVVLASKGYPDLYEKGIPITGIASADNLYGVTVFHAGTTYTDALRTSGGRVLNVTATGETLQEATRQAYKAVQRIHFDGMQYRKDIGESH
jgi:phosphoribosylamine---glycine ligase